MLVFSRKIGETFYIGDDISVTIVGVKQQQVRIGMRAPKNVLVHRQEICERTKAEEKNTDPDIPG